MTNSALFNPLTSTLNMQSNGPLYSKCNTVIDTLAVDGCAQSGTRHKAKN